MTEFGPEESGTGFFAEEDFGDYGAEPYEDGGDYDYDAAQPGQLDNATANLAERTAEEDWARLVVEYPQLKDPEVVDEVMDRADELAWRAGDESLAADPAVFHVAYEATVAGRTTPYETRAADEIADAGKSESVFFNEGEMPADIQNAYLQSYRSR